MAPPKPHNKKPHNKNNPITLSLLSFKTSIISVVKINVNVCEYIIKAYFLTDTPRVI